MTAEDELPCCRCSAVARLQCPKCLELQLPRATAAFCSQDCFKQAWPEHKRLHRDPTKSNSGGGDGATTGKKKKEDAGGDVSAGLFVTKRGRGRSKRMPEFAWTGTLRPYRVSPRRPVPEHIPAPDYAATGFPDTEVKSRQQHMVLVRSAQAIEGIRAACLLGRQVLDKAHEAIAPGVTTDAVDRVVHEATLAAGAYPSPLNYFNFPKSVCTSVNEVICHGIPDARPLENGDIVNVDISVYLNGYHGDLNETFVVGAVDADSKRLIRATHDALMKAIAICKPGMRYREVGEVISKHAQQFGFDVVRTYCGHGIGDLFHCAPSIPHYPQNKAVGIMKEGQVFTIEPMVNQGSWRDLTWPDGWTAVTEDGKRSAQFEHQLLITKHGCEVLTARLPTSKPLWWEAEAQAREDAPNGKAAPAAPEVNAAAS